MAESTSSPVLVVGLAEATLDLILPWVDAGHLPTFRHLMENGCHGPLRSRIPYIAPQMWGTIFTGTSAARHGALDFWQRGENGRFRETNGTALRETPVWDTLGATGLTSAVVNLPFTYPPRAIDGYMIAGEDAPGAHRSIANPPELYDELTREVGRYRLKDIFPGGRGKSDYLALPAEDIEKQTDMLQYLLERHPTDFFLTFYSATAICQHYFWSDMESADAAHPYRHVIENAYRDLDRAIGRLIRAAGPKARVFVISECGAGPLQSGVNLNAWLAQEGFLTYKSRGNAAARAGAVPETERSRRKVASLRRRAQGALQSRLPRPLYYLANRHLGGIKALLQSYVVNAGIDWRQTQAFSRGKEGNVYINLAGRDPRGTVRPQDYDAVCDAIAGKLEALVDPDTGLPAVEKVYRSKELYAGPLERVAPDITIAWRGGLYCPHEGDRDDASVFVTRWREYMSWPTSGGHRLDGILFAMGPGIRRGHRIDGAGIEDLAPTWLHAFGRDIPESIEGSIIDHLFEPLP